MAAEARDASVQLAGRESASSVLYEVLAETIFAFPEDLASTQLPNTLQAFRKKYPDWLPRYEAVRLASTRRVEIARYAAAAAAKRVLWQDRSESSPLSEALTEPAAPLDLNVSEPKGEPGWRSDFVYRGERWPVERLPEFADELAGRGLATTSVADGLGWMSRHVLEGGNLRLPGRKIAVLGAAAEMASTRFWAEAGAEILWIDVVPPPANWLSERPVAGRIHWARGNADILACPREVLATIMAFAEGEPIDLCLYAYAPGQARELRLTGTMNAIVNALPPAIVRTVTMLVSPTTPTALDHEDLAAMNARRDARPAWESLLAAVGGLGRAGGCAEVAGGAATRSVVGIQGASYQAAQYLGKVLMAECWANHGSPESEVLQPLRVSANTAAITRTRSLDHPVFAAAFAGASAFGVETFTPRLSRRINGLLAACDWLRPDAPVPGKVRVHGGIHTLPYPLESALRVAATIGFVRSPRLLRGLLRRG